MKNTLRILKMMNREMNKQKYRLSISYYHIINYQIINIRLSVSYYQGKNCSTHSLSSEEDYSRLFQ